MVALSARALADDDTLNQDDNDGISSESVRDVPSPVYIVDIDGNVIDLSASLQVVDAVASQQRMIIALLSFLGGIILGGLVITVLPHER